MSKIKVPLNLELSKSQHNLLLRKGSATGLGMAGYLRYLLECKLMEHRFGRSGQVVSEKVKDYSSLDG